MRYALVSLLLFSTGCAGVVDLGYLLVGSDARDEDVGVGYETAPVHHERRVRFDASSGLICEDVERPTVRRTGSSTDSEHPNGWLATMWGGTIVDGVILTTVVIVRELGCDEQCAPREEVYPWFSPVAASFLWGIFRSLTIHPEILETGSTARSTSLGGEYVYPCPPGTVVELEVEHGGRVPLRIDQLGRLAESERVVLIDLLRLEGDLHAWIGGVQVEIIPGRLQALRAEARALVEREREEARRRAAPPPPIRPPGIPMPPPPPPRPDGVRIEIEGCIDGLGCSRR